MRSENICCSDYVNKIFDWIATVLPNVLGSTVVTQPNYLNWVALLLPNRII
jgi:hypothetical protein